MLEDILNKFKSKCNEKSHSLINCFMNIDVEIIDWDKSQFEEEKDFIVFNYYRLLDNSYPIHLEIGVGKQSDRFSLWFGYKDNPIVEICYEILSDEGLVLFAEKLINNFLESHIIVKVELLKGKMTALNFSGDKLKDEDGSLFELGIRYKIIWFWQKRHLIFEDKHYAPWVS